MAIVTRRLLASRFWRSLAQGALVVDLSLYLHALGWSGTQIGGVLTAGGFFSAAASLFVGIGSDHTRRKPFVVTYEALSCLCAIAALITANPLILSPAIVLAGFGRGASGSPGPFGPAEQAWLAEAVKFANRGMVYSLNMCFGFCGMALGALAAALPALWRDSLGVSASYRPLFALVLLGNAVNLWLILRTPEAKSTAKRKPTDHKKPAPKTVSPIRRARENRFLAYLVLLNIFNGLAIGMIGPMIAYWFDLKFNISAEAIGPFMAVTFVLTAIAALGMGFVTKKIGLVQTIVWGRGSGVILLFIMPLMPFYLLAAAIYAIRSMVNRGSAGARQALIISAVRDERRGFAISVHAVSQVLPAALGPVVAGAFFDAGWLELPFYIAAVLQLFYVILYATLFTPYERRLNQINDMQHEP